MKEIIPRPMRHSRKFNKKDLDPWLIQVPTIALYLFCFSMLSKAAFEAMPLPLGTVSKLSALLCSLSVISVVLVALVAAPWKPGGNFLPILLAVWIALHSWVVFWYNALLYGGGIALLH
ncbi:MAG: hypothetical protein JJU11_02805 [Candidatus Sumerlaeia bacterium]|nr:hypothetical protein [Candidatus Sumerlaeia bacterium]